MSYSDIYNGPPKYGDSTNSILLKIWYRIETVFKVLTGGPGATYVFAHVANSGSTTIPITAKRWSVNFIGTGTANTFGTNTAVTGGQGFSDNAAPAVAIAIVCDGSTVADIFYSTT